ncbi:hypothetical protein Bbelb_214270 [Branchiostoma belcheri]|nr:hypothetical protein Bbelb_214270 [Branchiostoma belcheri]
MILLFLELAAVIIGPVSSLDINECASTDPCVHGTCINEVGYSTCACDGGWAGRFCNYEIDECSSSPCVNAVQCTDHLDSFSCECLLGYTGPRCEIDIDECASNPCQHGQCNDGVNGYSCYCDAGWTGIYYIDECASNPCWLGATCVDQVNGYSCVCPKDSTGGHCETVIFAGECYEFSNNAATHPDATQACNVKNGHMVDVTTDRQQRFLAETIALGSGVSNWLAMKAAPLTILYSNGSPFSAPFQWSASQPDAPCDLCVLLDSSDNFLGKTVPCTEQHNYVCKSALTPCQPNVCQNGGNCTSCFSGTTTLCEYLDGYEGDFCEIDIDECASNPCQHSGICQHGINSYSCSCLAGFQGANCETAPGWCSQVQCPQGWTCEDHTFYFICTDPSTTNRMVSYQCNSASCPDAMYCTKEGLASFSCKFEEAPEKSYSDEPHPTSVYGPAVLKKDAVVAGRETFHHLPKVRRSLHFVSHLRLSQKETPEKSYSVEPHPTSVYGPAGLKKTPSLRAVRHSTTCPRSGAHFTLSPTFV